MGEETVCFVTHVIETDSSIMDFLDADYTFLNERLAKHYGIEGLSGEEFRLVKLEPGQHRGGLLTQGSILTLTSPPTRTSPVKRGIWVLQTLFNDPPSPPPADVPPLEQGGVLTGTVRQVLERTARTRSVRAATVRSIRMGWRWRISTLSAPWRTKEGEAEIDPSGALPNGKSYRDLTEFSRYWTKRRTISARHLWKTC